ncbi:transglutaminase domain-containing protein [Flammeovirga pacifica]|uniref:Transglutaminase-like domain-containing protein n=1 Tax=Flammeovirga pacifica TaxID=915059 RepID=A0A1S1YSQ5_FLAPC|nr:transglutaminase domain-containing protein [Flammeovirga pacifica]OHX64061.1 hypothetical protein NH26_20860 [Flammeovirga pacifica]
MNKFLLLTILLLTTFFSSFSQIREVEESAKYAPKHATTSVAALADYLTANENTDRQKALNIYTWIVHNIELDIKAYTEKKVHYETAEYVLKKRKGISHDFANLFLKLCESANIETHLITGHIFTDNKSITTNFYKANHSWNSVYLDGEWHLVDVTWGCGVISKQQTKSSFFKKKSNFYRPQFISKVDYSYFCTSPKLFIETHLPSNPVWQLLEYEVTVQDFIAGRFPFANTVVRNSAKLDEYILLEDAESFYIDAKNAISYNKKNFSTMGVASLKMAESMLDKKDSTISKEELHDILSKYYEEATNSAYSYLRFIDLYSSIEIDALKLWVRHYLQQPIDKRQKFIDRNWINKDEIKEKNEQITSAYNYYQELKHKLGQKKYPELKKPRREVDYDEFYIGVQQARLVGIDSAISVSFEHHKTLEVEKDTINAKLEHASRDLRNLSSRQIKFLGRLEYLLKANVSLNILEHQAHQVMHVESNIKILSQQVKALEKLRTENHTVLSKQTSVLKRLYKDKQELLKGLYIKSKCNEAYKEEYDKITVSTKSIFHKQLDEKYHQYEKLKEHVSTLEIVNENLTQQKELIKQLDAIVIAFTDLKTKEIEKDAQEAKNMCDNIIQVSLEKANSIKKNKTL